SFVVPSVLGQEERGQESRPQGQASDEQKMAMAIVKAPDTAAKVKAATDFVKKHPKSKLRPQVAKNISYEISKVVDPTQKVTLAQAFQANFTDPGEQEEIMPILIKGLEDAHRPDEAFSMASDFLSKNPDSLPVLVQTVGIGSDEAKAKNGKFIPQSIQDGL